MGDYLSHLLVSELIQVNSVEGQGFFGLFVKLQGRAVQVDVSHACFTGRLLGGLGEGGEVFVVALAPRQVTVLQVLEGDRAEQHDAWKILSVGLVTADLRYEINQQFLVAVGSLRAGKGLVVTEHGKDHVGFHVLEVLSHWREALASRILIGTVPGQAHVAEGNLLAL